MINACQSFGMIDVMLYAKMYAKMYASVCESQNDYVENAFNKIKM